MRGPVVLRPWIMAVLTVTTLAVAAPAWAQANSASARESDATEQGGSASPPAGVAGSFRLPGGGALAPVQRTGHGWYFGVRGGYYFDVEEPFAGAELLFPLSHGLWFNPNGEWVFVDFADIASANADVHLDLTPSGPYMFWIGAGLGFRYFNLNGPSEGDWDPGLNLLAGLGFGGREVIPYIQGKVFIDGDNSEFILAGGFRF